MKRLLLLCLTLLFLTLPVSADILWEPLGNDFYDGNYQNMTAIGAAYVVPDDLTVNLYASPIKGKCLATLRPGTRVYVGFSTAIDGEVWGVGYALEDWEAEGWFRLGRLQREYSHENFLQDYSDSITASTEEDSIPVKQLNGTVHTWTWPGSGVSAGSRTFDGTEKSYNDGLMTFLQIYTDPDGGRWGYIGYYMGRCGWVYLDDPYAVHPPLSLTPQAENTVTDTSPEEPTTAPSLLWIVIPVSFLILGTGLLILRLRKKYRQPTT